MQMNRCQTRSEAALWGAAEFPLDPRCPNNLDDRQLVHSAAYEGGGSALQADEPGEGNPHPKLGTPRHSSLSLPLTENDPAPERPVLQAALRRALSGVGEGPAPRSR